MNKKIIAALCGVLVSGTAAAEDVRFYLGGDLGYNKHSYGATIDAAQTAATTAGLTSSVKKNVPTLGVLAGVKYCDNFGAELGYTFYKKAKVSVSDNTEFSVKVSNLHADLLGYLPVSNEVNLIGAVGLGRVNSKVDKDGTIIADQKVNKVGFRLGLGGEYKFDDCFAARAMVRYQKVGKKNEFLHFPNSEVVRKLRI